MDICTIVGWTLFKIIYLSHQDRQLVLLKGLIVW